MVRELGLVELMEPDTDQGKPAYAPIAKVKVWGGTPLEEQIARLIRFWLDNYSWRDVYGVHYKPNNTYTYTWNASGGRAALLRQLATCAADQWYSIASLLDILWEKEPLAFRQQNVYQQQRLPRRESERRAVWETCESEVYTGILASTLYELGLVSVGHSSLNHAGNEPTNPDMFLLTKLGKRLIAQVTEVAATLSLQDGKRDEMLAPVVSDSSQGDQVSTIQEQQQGRSLVVQPNFELLLLQPDFATLYALLPFAQANSIGLVSKLTLTKASVIRGLMAGMTTDQELAVLREASQRELPQNVEYSIQDWTRTYRGVGVSQVLLFEVSHEDVIPRLKKMAPIKDLPVRQIGPTMLLVQGEVDIAALRKIMEKEDIQVRVNGDIFTRPRQSYSYSYTSYPSYGRY